MHGNTVWTPEKKAAALDTIYASVAAGVSLNRTLQLEEGMPPPRTFWRWHMESEDIQHNLARARENGVEALLEEAMDVASTPMEGVEIEEIASDEAAVEEGGKVIKIKRKDMLGHRRLVVDTYIRRAQMIAPRKYGPKLDLTTGGKPVTNDIGEQATRLAAILAEAQKRKEQEKGE